MNSTLIDNPKKNIKNMNSEPKPTNPEPYNWLHVNPELGIRNHAKSAKCMKINIEVKYFGIR